MDPEVVDTLDTDETEYVNFTQISHVIAFSLYDSLREAQSTMRHSTEQLTTQSQSTVQ